jgi:hypothetical protein
VCEKKQCTCNKYEHQIPATEAYMTLKKGYLSTVNSAKHEKGDMLADSHSTSNSWKKYIWRATKYTQH